MSAGQRSRLGMWASRNGFRLQLATLAFLLAFVFLAPDIFYSVHAGQGAVLWQRFFGGTVTSRVFREGTHLKLPWDLVEVYDLRLQEVTGSFDALSADGLQMNVSVTARYRLGERNLGFLHKEIGPGYRQTLVLPELAADSRRVMARYEPDELYSGRRARVEAEIAARMNAGLGRRAGGPQRAWLTVRDVLIRSIVLPPEVKRAIDSKLAQRHLMLEYDYRLLKEEKERQRKAIEAEGIRRFQDIITGGISERYLRWKGIEATLELARSNNAKIVVIGSGEGGLPLILGNLDVPAPAASSPPAAEGAKPPPGR